MCLRAGAKGETHHLLRGISMRPLSVKCRVGQRRHRLAMWSVRQETKARSDTERRCDCRRGPWNVESFCAQGLLRSSFKTAESGVCEKLCRARKYLRTLRMVPGQDTLTARWHYASGWRGGGSCWSDIPAIMAASSSQPADKQLVLSSGASWIMIMLCMVCMSIACKRRSALPDDALVDRVQLQECNCFQSAPRESERLEQDAA